MKIVSCPMCGRCSFNSQGFLKEVEHELLASGRDLCVAIMGCQVNGPGEARGADLAVTGIGNKVYLYRKGEIYREISADKAKEELLRAVADFEK